VNTAVTITDTIARTVVYLAFIGAGLKLLLAVAPRFQIAAPKAPPQPKRDSEAKSEPDEAPAASAGPVALEKVS
jgi:hypothetical protein